ncbi:MAG: hypothetical protein ABWY80_04495 [Acidimicrobiia bacterium]
MWNALNNPWFDAAISVTERSLASDLRIARLKPRGVTLTSRTIHKANLRRQNQPFHGLMAQVCCWAGEVRRVT